MAIEEPVAAACTEATTLREKHVYREALRALVRLAKSEQTLEIKTQVNKLSAGEAARSASSREGDFVGAASWRPCRKTRKCSLN
jgi:hypothetical protein